MENEPLQVRTGAIDIERGGLVGIGGVIPFRLALRIGIEHGIVIRHVRHRVKSGIRRIFLDKVPILGAKAGIHYELEFLHGDLGAPDVETVCKFHLHLGLDLCRCGGIIRP